jgi:hypothetical protein
MPWRKMLAYLTGTVDKDAPKRAFLGRGRVDQAASV